MAQQFDEDGLPIENTTNTEWGWQAGEAEPELRLVAVALVLGILGICGLVMKIFTGSENKVGRFLRACGLLSMVFLVVTLIMVLAFGRIQPFGVALKYSFLGLMSGGFNNTSYTETCSEGMHCGIYCCRGFGSNSNLVWRDCDSSCGSVTGVLGDLESTDCLMKPRKFFCKLTGNQGHIDDLVDETTTATN
jgi:hypothetical protein